MDASDDIVDLLRNVLKNENIKQFSSVKAAKNPAGDGYMGDIIFVEAVGELKDGSSKNYDLVLKCGKRSKALRASTPAIKQIYENEIHAYDQIFPKFTAFQLERGVEDVFDSIPKCRGTFVGSDEEVLALENLKHAGYYLWDKKQPLTRKHLEVVLKAYGKWHAISAAMLDQKPDEFNEIAEKFGNPWAKQTANENEETPATGMFSNSMKTMYEIIKDNLSADEKEKWQSLEKLIPVILDRKKSRPEDFSVMLHGDCWSNNFMYQNDENGLPSTVAILDWQVISLGSPGYDLSYFLHTCAAEDDLKDCEGLLKVYYGSFSNHTRKLGSDPEKLYPFSKFKDAWKKAVTFGVILSTIIMKIAYGDPENIPDIAENAEKGGDLSKAFSKGEVVDKAGARARMSYIFRNAIAEGVI